MLLYKAQRKTSDIVQCPWQHSDQSEDKFREVNWILLQGKYENLNFWLGRLAILWHWTMPSGQKPPGPLKPKRWGQTLPLDISTMWTLRRWVEGNSAFVPGYLWSPILLSRRTQTFHMRIISTSRPTIALLRYEILHVPKDLFFISRSVRVKACWLCCVTSSTRRRPGVLSSLS